MGARRKHSGRGSAGCPGHPRRLVCAAAVSHRHSRPDSGDSIPARPEREGRRGCLTDLGFIVVGRPLAGESPAPPAAATIGSMTPNQPGAPPKAPIAGVKNLIAVGSGKGGVGKTTVAVNLAVGLASLGYKAGLMDADVYGPNVPLMMGINRTPMAFGDRIQPIEQYGVKLMSMGFLNPGDKPLIWRGPMLHRSEEHTSELQLLRHLVCRLLLEK